MHGRLARMFPAHTVAGRLGQTASYEDVPLDLPVVLPLVHRPYQQPGQMKGG